MMRFTRHAVVLALAAGPLSSVAAERSLPWKAGDRPPVLAGFTLLENGDSARARLGRDARVQTLGSGPGASHACTDAVIGLEIIVSPADGVAVIYVTRRETGDLDGIRVGDESSAVVKRWGKPTVVQQATALWVVGDWVVVVDLGEGNRVVRIGLG